MKIHVGIIATLSCVTAACTSTAPAPALLASTTWLVADSVPPDVAGRVRLGDDPATALTALAIPATDTLRYPTRVLAAQTNLLVIKLFDEHPPRGAPGPVVTPAWVRRNLGMRVADASPAKIVAGLPAYGYLWRPQQPAQRVNLGEARRAASEANVELVRDPSSGSLHAVQPGGWELWIIDDEGLRLLRAEAAALGVDRVALFVKR